METNIIAKSIEQSQSTKDEPWFFVITTEGFVIDGYLDNELDYARKVLDGTLRIRHYYPSSIHRTMRQKYGRMKSHGKV